MNYKRSKTIKTAGRKKQRTDPKLTTATKTKDLSKIQIIKQLSQQQKIISSLKIRLKNLQKRDQNFKLIASNLTDHWKELNDNLSNIHPNQVNKDGDDIEIIKNEKELFIPYQKKTSNLFTNLSKKISNHPNNFKINQVLEKNQKDEDENENKNKNKNKNKNENEDEDEDQRRNFLILNENYKKKKMKNENLKIQVSKNNIQTTLFNDKKKILNEITKNQIKKISKKKMDLEDFKKKIKLQKRQFFQNRIKYNLLKSNDIDWEGDGKIDSLIRKRNAVLLALFESKSVNDESKKYYNLLINQRMNTVQQIEQLKNTINYYNENQIFSSPHTKRLISILSLFSHEYGNNQKKIQYSQEKSKKNDSLFEQYNGNIQNEIKIVRKDLIQNINLIQQVGKTEKEKSFRLYDQFQPNVIIDRFNDQKKQLNKQLESVLNKIQRELKVLGDQRENVFQKEDQILSHRKRKTSILIQNLEVLSNSAIKIKTTSNKPTMIINGKQIDIDNDHQSYDYGALNKKFSLESNELEKKMNNLWQRVIWFIMKLINYDFKIEGQNSEIREYINEIEEISKSCSQLNKVIIIRKGNLEQKNKNLFETSINTVCSKEINELYRRENVVLREQQNYFKTIPEDYSELFNNSKEKKSILEKINQKRLEELSILSSNLIEMRKFIENNHQIENELSTQLKDFNFKLNELKQILKNGLNSIEDQRLIRNRLLIQKKLILNKNNVKYFKKIQEIHLNDFQKFLHHQNKFLNDYSLVKSVIPRKLKINYYKSLATCKVCGIHLIQIVILNCGHTFCKKCLISRMKLVHKCQTCNQDFDKNSLKVINLFSRLN
ncbi:ring finger protein-related [Anaeramoeba flamelloides]|uniref:E3 ubiquitin protein ligase n=1 Tax=Anaeramoeba flamelloides TaxID=1746091 RepID=A0AAV7YKB4_9EUKA|nr:ring finger protein-related [Anaeramoeba flamelloides]